MKTAEYISAIKAAHHVSSDYAVAKLLRVSRQTVSMYVTGRRIFDTRTCFRVAELLKDQPAAVIAHIELERAEKTAHADDAEEWKGWVKRLGGAAASILLGALMLGGPSNGAASSLSAGADHPIHRIKRKKKATPWTGLMAVAL